MRTAITQELKEITEFGNRVYQAFSSPDSVSKPYCTFKLTGELPVMGNKKGSNLELQIYIYDNPASFTSLDELELKVRQKLHVATLQTDDSPPRDFTIYYNQTLPDFFDDVRKLFQKIIYFTIPLSRA
jgi:hypothetical protein